MDRASDTGRFLIDLEGELQDFTKTTDRFRGRMDAVSTAQQKNLEGLTDLTQKLLTATAAIVSRLEKVEEQQKKNTLAIWAETDDHELGQRGLFRQVSDLLRAAEGIKKVVYGLAALITTAIGVIAFFRGGGL